MNPTTRDRLKWAMFPGLNLHSRERIRMLPERFGGPRNGEVRRVLDAGCGNGMFSYESYLRGNHVLGVSIKRGEVERNQRLFHGLLRAPREKLRFECANLYELESLGFQFDEIVCSEVLEHIRDDRRVVQSFWDALKPGGILHLCCPNAEHPDHQNGPIDETESGGHVRQGYTLGSYKALLGPIGFEIERSVGLGGPLRQWGNKQITRAQNVGGIPLGMATFCLLAPLAWMDRRTPKVPYSIYVQARRPARS